jgi:hypothetical protein
LAVAAGDNANKYTVFNSNKSSTPSSAGSFSTAVAKDSPTYTYAVSDTGNKVYAAVSANADGSVTIDAQSTAEAMVLLNPLLIPRTSVERTQIITIVKADAAVRSLATVIESVYGSVADPLSDTRISDALTSAVSSVLTSWQAANSAVRQATPKSVPLAYVTRSSVSGSSSLQIVNNDMGALTLDNSAGATLKLELNNVGPGGITTNVDWVVRIVELDPAKIQWTQYGGAQLTNPTYTDIDSLIKAGGYDQKTIIEGAVGTGLLKFIVDPIGRVASSFGDIVFPDNGITLPHDGVYAVIALSGSSNGDSAEYNSVKNSAWQRSQSAEAASINIGAAAIDVIGVGTTFLNAATGVDIDISGVLELELGAIKTELTANPDYIGSAYVVGKTADISGKLLDYLQPYMHSAISDIQSSGWKKFFHIAVNTAQSVLDVWSGTVSATTRVGNFIYNVTPRESGYAVLGTFSPSTPTCTLPQVLTNGVCVTPPPTCTLPQVLTNGVCITPTPTCISPQVLTNGVCVTPPPTCTSPQVLINGVCVTPISPTVQSWAATLITTTTAQMNGYVDPNGYLTTAYFEYGTTTSYGTATNSFDLSTPTSIMSINWSGLPNTTYHYRAVATNIAGTSRGGDLTFTTAAVSSAPTVQSLAATLVTATTVQSNGSVNPNGLSTSAYFEIGTTTSYGSTSSLGIFSGTSAIPVYVSWTGLTPSTTYHYRVVATNTDGTSTGSDMMFTTLAATTVCTEVEPNDSSLNANPLTLGVGCTGYISTGTDKDWFDINVSSGTTITFNLQIPAGLDYDIELFGPSNTFLVGSYSGAGLPETITYTTTAAGYYAVKVYGWNGAFSTGSTYTITRTQ